ncbi:MAG TPA: aspartate/glutamate racemase family protein [Thermoanaerobaculia bacterium]|nr:aspartate/glutamate racemase family protein [Thermoanaerobaculia bacterium]
MGKRIGILGGMGPLASAEFLGTLYRANIDAPVCVMISDPTVPDRTERILRGDTGELAERLASTLAELAMMGADAIVIACVDHSPCTRPGSSRPARRGDLPHRPGG